MLKKVNNAIKLKETQPGSNSWLTNTRCFNPTEQWILDKEMQKTLSGPILNLLYIERKYFTKCSFPVPKQVVDFPEQQCPAVTQIAIQIALQKTTIVIQLCNIKIIFEQVHVYQVYLPILVEEAWVPSLGNKCLSHQDWFRKILTSSRSSLNILYHCVIIELKSSKVTFIWWFIHIYLKLKIICFCLYSPSWFNMNDYI